MRCRLGRYARQNAVAFLALFVALGGVGWSATGGTFILGAPNSATSTSSVTASVAAPALRVANGSTAAGATPLTLLAGQGRPPMSVNSAVRVTNLNADRLDGLDAGAFARLGIPQTGSVGGEGAVLDVTNAGVANGIRGRTASALASGVYGESTAAGGGGYGVAGRAAGRDGVAVYGDNTTGGWAGWFEDDVFLRGRLQCDGCIDAQDVAGGQFVRGAGTAQRQVLHVPGGSSLDATLDTGFVPLRYTCPTGAGTTNGTLHFGNREQAVAHLFVDTGTDNPAHYVMNRDSGLGTLPAAAGGDSFRIHAALGGASAVIDVATFHAPNSCHAQIIAIFVG